MHEIYFGKHEPTSGPFWVHGPKKCPWTRAYVLGPWAMAHWAGHIGPGRARAQVIAENCFSMSLVPGVTSFFSRRKTYFLKK